MGRYIEEDIHLRDQVRQIVKDVLIEHGLIDAPEHEDERNGDHAQDVEH